MVRWEYRAGRTEAKDVVKINAVQNDILRNCFVRVCRFHQRNWRPRHADLKQGNVSGFIRRVIGEVKGKPEFSRPFKLFCKALQQ
jgi:hypothetical protein